MNDTGGNRRMNKVSFERAAMRVVSAVREIFTTAARDEPMLALYAWMYR